MNKYMTQRVIQQNQLLLLVGTFCLLTGMLFPAMLQAAPGISARYVQSHGTRLVIEINSGANPPASAILIQRLPPGVRILSSQPGPKHYSEDGNSAKWLFRNLQPGISTVSITLDRPVTANEISAEVRFKPQQDGKMATIQVGK